MKIRYDLQTLFRILQDISVLTGISISLQDAQRQPLTACVRANSFCQALQERQSAAGCAFCDARLLDRCAASRQVEGHLCHMGLYDLAMPLMKDGLIVGYLLMGQIRTQASPEAPTIPELLEAYRQVPYFTQERLESLTDLLPRILFQSAVVVEDDALVRRISAYIEENLARPISIDTLCGTFYLSKNQLYRLFHSHFGCSVGAFLLARRLQRAQKLLAETQDPACNIAEAVGMANYPYFCRIFRRETGLTPIQYRRQKKTASGQA